MPVVPTPAQTVGPFFSLGLGDATHGEVVDRDQPGAVAIAGTVRDGDGRPVPDALLELWQEAGCARAATTEEGEFSFVTVKPAPLLGADGAEQAPHIAVSIFATGLLQHLTTRIYFPDESEANARDPLLATLDDPSSLIARPDGDGLRFDVNLQGEDETVFLDA